MNSLLLTVPVQHNLITSEQRTVSCKYDRGAFSLALTRVHITAPELQSPVTVAVYARVQGATTSVTTGDWTIAHCQLTAKNPQCSVSLDYRFTMEYVDLFAIAISPEGCHQKVSVVASITVFPTSR